MKVVIAGGSGFLGNELVHHYENVNCEVVVLTRGKSKLVRKINYVHWDAVSEGDWEDYLNDTDVVINLTGKTINCRFTDANKFEIINSRVNATRILQTAINKLDKKPSLWINASAASIYGQENGDLMTEDNLERGDDFSAKVAQSWENAFFDDKSSDVRKVALRISLILGKNGGVFPVLRKLTRFGLGGKMGNGRQNFGWVHVTDVIRLIDFIIKKEEISGPVNCVSVSTPTNKEFMRSFRKALHMPFGLPQPKILLKIGSLIIGTESELILASISAYPKRLIESGFKFKFDNAQDALNDLCE